ncbi:MAG: helix-turn-helix domain-containing protein [Minicystis sp.]
MSNALPLSMSNANATLKAPAAPQSHWNMTPANRAAARPAPMARFPELLPPPPPSPMTMSERMMIARSRIRGAAEAGQRIRSYEVALDLDLSEFHFARQFRAAFGRSPHVYYDEVRAECARALLRTGMSESDVARRVGFRRPAELRSLLSKRCDAAVPAR